MKIESNLIGKIFCVALMGLALTDISLVMARETAINNDDGQREAAVLVRNIIYNSHVSFNLYSDWTAKPMERSAKGELRKLDDRNYALPDNIAIAVDNNTAYFLRHDGESGKWTWVSFDIPSRCIDTNNNFNGRPDDRTDPSSGAALAGDPDTKRECLKPLQHEIDHGLQYKQQLKLQPKPRSQSEPTPIMIR
jgi:hypothetical protein